MATFKRGVVGRLAGIALLVVIALTPGCDWLKGSDMIRRASPFLSGLSISRGTVLCESEFEISFSYDDPQGDIFQAKITLQHDGDSTTRDASSLWPDGTSTSSGSVSFPYSFSCDDPGGRWTITVVVEDDLGHTSNILTGSITLSGGA